MMSQEHFSLFSDLPNPPLRITYSGHVQGVGFRWTCKSIAKTHPVTGTVRNLPAGTVELVVDGAGLAVAAFLSEIQRQLAGNIADVDISPAEESSHFTDFRILR